MGRESYGDVTLAFLLGAVTGAAVALLYAPATGAETRRKLAEASARLRDNSEEKFEQAKDYLGDKYDASRAYLQDRKDEVSAAVSAGKDAFRKAKEQH
ncbi:MAG TPA: YtxH domain-containing protein [bacterium]|nr:YtxH domain-containing protein [bacterium]